MGLRTILNGFALWSAAAHKLARPGEALMGAYAYIAAQGSERLLPAVWMGGERPALCFADGQTPLVAQRTERRRRQVLAVPHRPASRALWQRRYDR